MKDPRDCTTEELFELLREQPALFNKCAQWFMTDKAGIDIMEALTQNYANILYYLERAVKQEINHYADLLPTC